MKEQASNLWRRLLQYTGKAEPKWSNGWLGGFKARFNIKEYITHGEGGSAAIKNLDTIKQMEDVRSLYT